MKSISPLPLVGLLPSMVAALLIASCGGGTSSSTIPDTPAPPGNDPPPTLAPTGAAIIKFRAMDNEWAALVEKLRAIEDFTAPDRRLLLARNNNSSPIEIDPPSGWSLIDFALHPSGEISMLLATDSHLRLQRRDSDGALLNDAEFTDPLAATDPFVGDLSAIRDSQSLVPKSTRDAARLTAIAEDVLLVFRSGRNAVIEQRFS